MTKLSLNNNIFERRYKSLVFLYIPKNDSVVELSSTIWNRIKNKYSKVNFRNKLNFKEQELLVQGILKIDE